MARARIVIFTDSRIYVGPYLTRTFIAAAHARGDAEVAAVVDTAPVPYGGMAAVRALAERAARRVFDPAHPLVRRPAFDALGAMLRRRGIPWLVPPARDVNAHAFVGQTLPGLDADFALTLICLRIFGAPLRAVFQRTINYHNGALPAYRGLNATAWSVYRREPASGFSYHWLTAGVDEGAVVATGEVPISSAVSLAGIEWEKTRLAAAAADHVLNALLSGASGVAQTGTAGYYGRAELRAVTTVGDPAAQTWDALQARIRAFGRVRLRIAGAEIDATRIRRARVRSRASGLAFVTADGVAAEVDRVGFLPPALGMRFGRAARG